MVKITDRFYINASANCYLLQEKTKVQDENSKNYGQEIFKDLGYYTTLESCLKGILTVVTRQFVSSEEINNIKELKEQIRITTEYIQSLNLKF